MNIAKSKIPVFYPVLGDSFCKNLGSKKGRLFTSTNV